MENSKWKTALRIGAAVAVIALLFLTGRAVTNETKTKNQIVSVISQLEKVLEISDLETA